MSRHGKIARLPGPIREQINQRLQNGENGREVIAWLNANDEVKAVLAAEFGGNEISDMNLSQRRHGGYRDWEMQQAAMAETRRIVSEGGELDDAGDKALGDKIAVWLLGRYAVATRKLIENEDDKAGWKLLREICHDLVAVRRGDHGAKWLSLEREKLEFHRQRDEWERNRQNAKSEPASQEKPAMSDEEQEAAWRQIFGMQPL